MKLYIFINWVWCSIYSLVTPKNEKKGILEESLIWRYKLPRNLLLSLCLIVESVVSNLSIPKCITNLESKIFYAFKYFYIGNWKNRIIDVKCIKKAPNLLLDVKICFNYFVVWYNWCTDLHSCPFTKLAISLIKSPNTRKEILILCSSAQT